MMTGIAMGQAIRTGELSIENAVDGCLSRIKQHKEYNAYITIDEEYIQRRIQSLKEYAPCDKQPLYGVPIVLKDNIATKGLRTTAASKMLKDFVPIEDATVTARLLDAGMVILGKTNMDEFAMGSTTETSFFGATKHPYDKTRMPGGSSGGSAVAVAMDVPLALGSDTGGSIRLPSSHCGIYGLKPSYSRVSRNGLIAYVSSMDTIGPMANCIEDIAMLYSIINGRDHRDATVTRERENISWDEMIQNRFLKGKTVGIVPQFYEMADPDIKKVLREAKQKAFECGAVIKEIVLPHLPEAIASYYILSCAQASSNLARYDGIKYGTYTKDFSSLDEMYSKTRTDGFGEETKKRILLGTFCLSYGYYDDFYRKALCVREEIKKTFRKIFCTTDVLLLPVSFHTAPKEKEFLQSPVSFYEQDVINILANMAGLPALTIPAGKDRNGLPIGVQVMADRFEEKQLIGVAYELSDGYRTGNSH